MSERMLMASIRVALQREADALEVVQTTNPTNETVHALAHVAEALAWLRGERAEPEMPSSEKYEVAQVIHPVPFNRLAHMEAGK